MGRFASTEFYARYREPYPPEFFKQSAQQIALRGDENLTRPWLWPQPARHRLRPFCRTLHRNKTADRA